MITIFRKTSQSTKLETVDNLIGGCWVHMVNPTKTELAKFMKSHPVPEEFIHASLDEDERPRIDKDENCILIIIRVPNHSVEDQYGVIPLGIILNSTCIITVCQEDSKVMDDFIDDRIKTFLTTKKIRFLLQMIKNANRYFEKHVDSIEKYLDVSEKYLLKTYKNEEIAKLLRLQKAVMYFHTAVVANDKVFNKLISSKLINIYQEDKELLEDLIVDNQQIIETLSIFNNILSNTMDAYASIVSNNLNVVMKFLTSFTIILSIPTIIASFYGMNVPLPLASNPYSFMMTILASVLTMFGVAYIFARKQYF